MGIGIRHHASVPESARVALIRTSDLNYSLGLTLVLTLGLILEIQNPWHGAP